MARIAKLHHTVLPLPVAELLDPDGWAVHTDTTVTARGFPAGVLVAERQQ